MKRALKLSILSLFIVATSLTTYFNANAGGCLHCAYVNDDGWCINNSNCQWAIQEGDEDCNRYQTEKEECPIMEQQ